MQPNNEIFTIIFELVVRHTTRLVKEIENILTVKSNLPISATSDQIREIFSMLNIIIYGISGNHISGILP
jgi:hypothetical protein